MQSVFNRPQKNHKQSSRWLVRQPNNAYAPMRLFCFPYSGGSATLYKSWQAHLPISWEVIGIEPPGRGCRLMEPAHRHMDSLINELVDEISGLLDVPFAFFGHSNGALVAFELARELQRRCLPTPKLVMLSAKNAPHIERQEGIHKLPREALIERLKQYNGTPEILWENEELMDLVLPLIRADFCVGETFECKTDLLLEQKVVIFSGDSDPFVDVHRLNEWQRYTSSATDVNLLKGDHFYFNHDLQQLTRHIGYYLDMITIY